jgi:hypothetical protein
MNYAIWLGFIIAIGVISIDYHLYRILQEMKKQ